MFWQGGRITLGIPRGDEENAEKLLLTALCLSDASIFLSFSPFTPFRVIKETLENSRIGCLL